MVTRARPLMRVMFYGLALAMVLAQFLGLMHGVIHSPLAEPVETVHRADGTANPHNWIERLFAGHGEDSDCRVYDQLSHADAAPSIAAVALPLALTPFVFSLLPGLAVARWHALFQARGPPHLR